jgi:hypothetical protein
VTAGALLKSSLIFRDLVGSEMTRWAHITRLSSRKEGALPLETFEFMLTQWARRHQLSKSRLRSLTQAARFT